MGVAQEFNPKGAMQSVYSRSQKIEVWPSFDPETRERRKTSINIPKSIFQLFAVYCRVSVPAIAAIVWGRYFAFGYLDP